jgi:3-oxoacyl-[acyl-carrier protein] reductase
MAEAPVILITGASRGIGNHLARHFLGRGYMVVGCSRGEYEEIDDPGYRHVVADVGVEEQVVELFREIKGAHERLDVVVNNAVADPTPSLVALTSIDAVTRSLATNVVGPFAVCREASRMMMRRRRGRIVNVGSMATAHPIAGGAVYTAAKAAVDALTRVLARELAPYGVTCNVVAPASAETDLLAGIGSERVHATLAHNAIREVGRSEDVAATVEWLASPAAAAVTGQVVYLGGA